MEEPWQDNESESGASGRPTWVDDVDVISKQDLRPAIEVGEHPLPLVMHAVRDLQPGQAVLLVTSFVPAPMIDRIAGDGFLAWTNQAGPEEFLTILAPPSLDVSQAEDQRYTWSDNRSPIPERRMRRRSCASSVARDSGERKERGTIALSVAHRFHYALVSVGADVLGGANIPSKDLRASSVPMIATRSLI